MTNVISKKVHTKTFEIYYLSNWYVVDILYFTIKFPSRHVAFPSSVNSSDFLVSMLQQGLIFYRYLYTILNFKLYH